MVERTVEWLSGVVETTTSLRLSCVMETTTESATKWRDGDDNEV